MEFESSLSCEQIKQRLSSKTQPYTLSLAFVGEDGIMSKWFKNNTFYIVKGSGIWALTIPCAFAGKVVAQDNGSIISGEFTPPYHIKRMLFVWAGAAWLLFALISRDVVAIIPGTIVTAFAYVIYKCLPSLIDRKNKEIIINFISQNLLE